MFGVAGCLAVGWKTVCEPTIPQKLRKTCQELSCTLQECSKTQFPTVHQGLRLLGTLPITTCQCERSISALRRLKSYLRTTMTEDHLQGLALLHVHNGFKVDIERVISAFARKHPRRMECHRLITERGVVYVCIQCILHCSVSHIIYTQCIPCNQNIAENLTTNQCFRRLYYIYSGYIDLKALLCVVWGA